MENKIERLQSIIDNAKRIVFFGGAGVSTESGIKDFRSVDGLYNEKYDYPPEDVLSDWFFEQNPTEFYRFYYDKLILDGVKPNSAHFKLAEMEKSGKLTAVITQNIDGLHQLAGSEKVYELHGSVERNHCLNCGKFFSGEDIATFKKQGVKIPKCECGGIIKPDVVLYGEPLDDKTLNGAIDAIYNADVMIVAGTSLTVYPASGLLNYFRGEHLILINKTPTQADKVASVVVYDKVGETLSKIKIK